MGAIGIKILEILRKLYGKEFVSKTIGTRANVVKPKEFDTNAPTKNVYSKDAFRDSKLQSVVDDKIQEYAPFIFSNRNQRELMNYLENAQQLLKQKKRDFGVTDQLESVGKPKPEADVLDIKTGKKPEGIETLREDLGLPPEVDPKSQMGKALLESKRTFKAMDDEIDDSDTLAKAVDSFFGTGKSTAKTFLEGRRRPIIRQILSEEPTITKNLSEDDYDGLLFGTDLDKGADPSKDPFAYLNKYFIRDEDQLDVLDDIIDEMPGSTPAEISAEFKKRTGGLKPKDPDLGDKLKDLPDDIDPDAMATGGRVGFSAGGIKVLLKLINDKFGTDTIKTADGLKGRERLLYTEKMAEALKDTEDFKEAEKLAPKLFERMEYKVKYPGITDELLDQLVSDTDPQRKATVLATLDEAFKMMDEGMTMDDVLSTIKKTPRTKQAGGGLSYLMGM